MRRLLAAGLAVLLLGTAACSEDGPLRGDQSSTHRPKDDHARTDRSDDAPSPRRWEPNAPIHVIPWHPPTSARELADRLFRAEHQVRAPYNLDVVVESAGFETQLLYRHLARTPGWQQHVLDRMRGLRRIAELHLTARSSLRSVLTTLSDELPAWEILEPPPTSDLLRFYREGERVHGVAWELLAAINLVETGFGKIRGLSTAGAQGPMQFIPSTWAAYGEGDINDPHDAILGAANYLAANGGGTGTVDGPGVENALLRYNNHQGYVDGILAYAEILERDPRALDGMLGWQIVFLSTIGDLWLPIGYRETAPVPVRQYAARHPERHLGTATN